MIPLFLLNIWYCSPLWLQSLEPCSISVYLFFGADLANPIKNITKYTNVNSNNNYIKLCIAPCVNIPPKVANGFVIFIGNCSINTVIDILPKSFVA